MKQRQKNLSASRLSKQFDDNLWLVFLNTMKISKGKAQRNMLGVKLSLSTLYQVTAADRISNLGLSCYILKIPLVMEICHFVVISTFSVHVHS